MSCLGPREQYGNNGEEPSQMVPDNPKTALTALVSIGSADFRLLRPNGRGLKRLAPANIEIRLTE